MDSNHDYGLQRPVCYHYTIGQGVAQPSQARTDCKVFFGPAGNPCLDLTGPRRHIPATVLGAFRFRPGRRARGGMPRTIRGPR